MQALLVDDSRAMRTILGGMLKQIGFSVIEAGHGLDGLAKLKTAGTVAVAMVDWNMPEMNGLEFVKAVRSDPQYNDLRLVMVTTETEAEQMAKAIEAGANEYVMKPFTRDVILGKLQLLGFCQ